MVQRLKRLSPAIGKRKIAQILARSGLHLGTTTVGRMLRQKPKYVPAPADDPQSNRPDRVVTAKYSGHVWHTDLTVVQQLSDFGSVGCRCRFCRPGPFAIGWHSSWIIIHVEPWALLCSKARQRQSKCALPGQNRCQSGISAQTLDLRQRPPVLVSWLQGMVQTP